MTMVRTNRHLEVLDFIASSIGRTGYSPSVREIRDGMGIGSTSTVAHHLKYLTEIGLLERAGGKASNRTLRLRGVSGACPTCGHHAAQGVR